jgi:hypothetical protein
MHVYSLQIIKRFWSHIAVGKPHECWGWNLCIRSGYGCFKVFGKTLLSHRVSWEITNGEIPTGMLVCHTCDNRKCCNPDHLYLGTHQDNSNDAVKRGRTAKGTKNGAHTHPESRVRGDRQWRRMYPERLLRGERNPSAKLTESQVVAIRGSTEGDLQLSRLYNVSRRAVNMIKNRETWKHVA